MKDEKHKRRNKQQRDCTASHYPASREFIQNTGKRRDSGNTNTNCNPISEGSQTTLFDYCPISFLLFCCDGFLLSFCVFHFNRQSVCSKQEGWQVCAADPDGHSTKRGLVREPSSSSIHPDLQLLKICVWFPHIPPHFSTNHGYDMNMVVNVMHAVTFKENQGRFGGHFIVPPSQPI